MNNNQVKEYVLPIGLLALVYFGGRSILQAVGVLKSEQAATNEKLILPGSPLTPSFYQNYKGQKLLLTTGAASAYSTVLKEAKGLFNDDEAAVLGIFQNMKTKSQVSYLSDVFQTIYGVSLVAFLLNFLSEDEFNQVAKIVNGLPDYLPR